MGVAEGSKTPVGPSNQLFGRGDGGIPYRGIDCKGDDEEDPDKAIGGMEGLGPTVAIILPAISVTAFRAESPAGTGPELPLVDVVMGDDERDERGEEKATVGAVLILVLF